MNVAKQRLSENIQPKNGTPLRSLSRLFACPACYRLETGLVFSNGRRRLCEECADPDGKSHAELWVKTDPSLRALIELLQEFEVYGETLPDFARAFDPVIQQIRVPLTRSGHVPTGADLSSTRAATMLPNLLVEIGAAETLHEAKSLRLLQVSEALEQAVGGQRDSHRSAECKTQVQTPSRAVDKIRQPTESTASNPTEEGRESDSAPRSAESSDDSQLRPEERAILEVLAANNAVDEDRVLRRQDLEELCKEEPYAVGARSFKKALTMVRNRGLVKAKPGPHGGRWLTEHGQALLKCDSHSQQSEETDRDTSAMPPLPLSRAVECGFCVQQHGAHL